MNTYYELRNGKKITLFYWSDEFMKNDDRREFVEVSEILPSGYVSRSNKKCRIHKDNDGIYFTYDGEKVYINNYEAMTDAEIIEYSKRVVGNKNDYRFGDCLWATLMKHGETLGFVMNARVRDIVGPLGISFFSFSDTKALFVVDENDGWYGEKSNWEYKLPLAPYRPEACIFGHENCEFSDFVSSIKRGDIEIVDKNAYIAEKAAWANAFVNEQSKKPRLFHKKKDPTQQEAADVIIYYIQ